MPDLRTERSESIEGKGIARTAWDAYSRGINKVAAPVITPAAGAISREWVAESMGFWLIWHLNGGFEGVERLGFHRATIFRKIKRFRTAFGAHPDEFRFPGVTVDTEAYWNWCEEQKL